MGKALGVVWTVAISVTIAAFTALEVPNWVWLLALVAIWPPTLVLTVIYFRQQLKPSPRTLRTAPRPRHEYLQAPWRRVKGKMEERKRSRSTQPGLALRPHVRVVTDYDHPKPNTIREFRTYTAQVLVHNSAEMGGDEGAVRNALPEFEMFAPSGESIFRYKGWDQPNPLDFSPRQEEHALDIAQVRNGELGQTVPPGQFVISGPKPFKVRVTVRADNIEPATGWFDLTHNAKKGFSFERADAPTNGEHV